ncbi:Kinase [Hexamita inflata]|uniref:Kinase n=1 Tax=Hexamita inflata TaxID=28002 RepID=A0AA86TFC8_9EUKA|nr:Kinase [Hexamita inflata]
MTDGVITEFCINESTLYNDKIIDQYIETMNTLSSTGKFACIERIQKQAINIQVFSRPKLFELYQHIIKFLSQQNIQYIEGKQKFVDIKSLLSLESILTVDDIQRISMLVVDNSLQQPLIQHINRQLLMQSIFTKYQYKFVEHHIPCNDQIGNLFGIFKNTKQHEGQAELISYLNPIIKLINQEYTQITPIQLDILLSAYYNGGSRLNQFKATLQGFAQTVLKNQFETLKVQAVLNLIYVDYTIVDIYILINYISNRKNFLEKFQILLVLLCQTIIREDFDTFKVIYKHYSDFELLCPLFASFCKLIQKNNSISGILSPIVLVPELYQNVCIQNPISQLQIPLFEPSQILLQQIYSKSNLKKQSIPLLFTKFFINFNSFTLADIGKAITILNSFFMNCFYDSLMNKLQFSPFNYFTKTIYDVDTFASKESIRLLTGCNIHQIFCQFNIKYYQTALKMFGSYQGLDVTLKPMDKIKHVEELNQEDILVVKDRINHLKLNNIEKNQLIQDQYNDVLFYKLFEEIYGCDQLEQFFHSHSVPIEFICVKNYLHYSNYVVNIQDIPQLNNELQTVHNFCMNQLKYCQQNEDMKQMSTIIMNKNLNIRIDHIKNFSALLYQQTVFLTKNNSMFLENYLDTCQFIQNLCQKYLDGANPSYYDTIILKFVQNLVSSNVHHIDNKTVDNSMQILISDLKPNQQIQLSKQQTVEQILIFAELGIRSEFLSKQLQENFNEYQTLASKNQLLLIQFIIDNIDNFEPDSALNYLSILYSQVQDYQSEIALQKEYQLCIFGETKYVAYLMQIEHYSIFEIMDLIMKPEQDANVTKSCIILLRNKIRKMPLSIKQHDQQLIIINYMFQYQFYQELYKFVIENKCHNQLTDEQAIVCDVLLSQNKLIQYDIKEQFSHSVYKSKDKTKNTIRSAMLNIIQQPVVSFVNWRSGQFSSDFEVFNIFDDFMNDQKQYDQLLIILINNIKQGKWQYLNITISMYISANIKTGTISNQINFKNIEKQMQYFEYEPINSMLTIRNKKSTNMFSRASSLFHENNSSQVEDTIAIIQKQCEDIIYQQKINDQQVNNKYQPREQEEEQKIAKMLNIFKSNIQLEITKVYNKLCYQLKQTQQLNGIEQVIILLLEKINDKFVFNDILNLDWEVNCELNAETICNYLIYNTDTCQFQLIQKILYNIFQKSPKYLLNMVSSKSDIIEQVYQDNIQLKTKAQDTIEICEDYVFQFNQILNIYNGTQKSFKLQNVQHPIYQNRYMSEVEIIAIPSSKNLVVIYQYKYTENGKQNIQRELIKYSDEDFKTSQILSQVIDILNSNLHQKYSLNSHVMVQKMQSFQLLLLKSGEIYQDCIQVLKKLRRNNMTQLNIQLIEFHEFIELNTILNHSKQLSIDMQVLQPNLRKDPMTEILCALNQNPNSYYQFKQNLSYNYLQEYLLSLTNCNFKQKLKTFQSSFVLNSIFTGVFGIGDRHLSNLTLKETEIFNIDVESSFYKTLMLKVPELVPFRFTPIFQYCFQDQFTTLCRMAHKNLFCNRQQLNMLLKQQFKIQALREYAMRLTENFEEFEKLIEKAQDDTLLCKLYCGWTACM